MANRRRFKFWGRSPLTVVEFLISIFSVIAGLYILIPALSYSTQVISAGSIIVALIGHPIAIIVYGVVYIISGLIILTGIVKRKYKLRSFGLFMNIIIRSYSLFGAFIIEGFVPLTWISSLLVLLIVLVCYLTVRGFIHRGIEA